MNMLGKLSAIQAMLAMDSMARSYPHEGNPVSFNPNNIKRPEPLKPKDWKPFIIEDQKIWALNMKNAIKKFNNLKKA
jgi:hypothetical protein